MAKAKSIRDKEERRSRATAEKYLSNTRTMRRAQMSRRQHELDKKARSGTTDSVKVLLGQDREMERRRVALDREALVEVEQQKSVQSARAKREER